MLIIIMWFRTMH